MLNLHLLRYICHTVTECVRMLELAVSSNLDPQILDHNSGGPGSWRSLSASAKSRVY